MGKKHRYLSKYNKKLRSFRKAEENYDGCTLPNTPDKDDERMKLFKKQRKKYRFDERETWSLDHTSVVWLYEHIRMYLDIGGKVVDLERPLTAELLEEIGKEQQGLATKKEVLEYICELIEKWDDQISRNIHDDKAWTYAQKALRLYAVILPYMWW